MGHWHIASKDVEANKKLFLAMGGKLMPGANPQIMFPGVLINLVLGTEKGNGATQGSVVNHVGFIVDNVQKRAAQWKAAGVNVLPGGNNRLDQAFVETPDGVRIEILEDKTQSMPIRNEHVHLSLPETEISKAQAWYAKTFGGKPSTRNNAPVVDIPGVQIRFARADAKQAPTRGRVLDHIGFDVKDHAAFVKKIQSEGIKLDEPPRKSVPPRDRVAQHDATRQAARPGAGERRPPCVAPTRPPRPPAAWAQPPARAAPARRAKREPQRQNADRPAAGTAHLRTPVTE